MFFFRKSEENPKDIQNEENKKLKDRNEELSIENEKLKEKIKTLKLDLEMYQKLMFSIKI